MSSQDRSIPKNVTKSDLDAAQERFSSSEDINSLTGEINELARPLDPESRNELLRGMAALVVQTRQGVDSRAAEKGEKTIYGTSITTHHFINFVPNIWSTKNTSKGCSMLYRAQQNVLHKLK